MQVTLNWGIIVSLMYLPRVVTVPWPNMGWGGVEVAGGDDGGGGVKLLNSCTQYTCIWYFCILYMCMSFNMHMSTSVTDFLILIKADKYESNAKCKSEFHNEESGWCD